jgi:hypothetical protein
VVLEDGRIIEESEPEITVDTVEDTQSHDEDGDEDRRYFDSLATVPRDSWSGDILSEKNQRNTYKKNIQERTVTTASARNLGDISAKDVDKVIRHGKRTRQFIRSHDDDSSSTDPLSIPAKVIHTGQSNRMLVDREDVREVSRMHEGKVKTERHVTREMIEDAGEDTPEDGDSTEETESRDGDRVHLRSVRVFEHRLGKPLGSMLCVIPGAHPSIESYNASVVNFYNATGSLACFKNKIFSSTLKTL